MSRLTTIYAHGNPYKLDRLQAWQAQHGTYHPFPSAAQQATTELKDILWDKAFLAIPKLPEQQENHQPQLGPNDSVSASDLSEDPNDNIEEYPLPGFLKNFASTSYLKEGNVNVDLFPKIFYS